MRAKRPFELCYLDFLEYDLLQKITSLCKRRGFIYQNSEIYGGIANAYDYGPLGAELLRNLKNLWWERFVTRRPEIYGIDGAIISHPKVWEASGHVESLVDEMVECKECKKRYRVDHFFEDFVQPYLQNKNPKISQEEAAQEYKQLLESGKVIPCPNCGSNNYSQPRSFNILFMSHIGTIEGEGSKVYLRGETAQNMFVNFKNIVDSFRPKLPFGVAQIGKAFRNEITLGPFIFRTFEFEQMEIEYFVHENEWEKHFENWKKEMWQWLLDLGVNEQNIRWRAHSKEELSHYSKRTEDVEYNFPFGGFKELYGLAYRTDFDLKQQAQYSGQDLRFTDPVTGEKFYPHIVEPTFGVNRTLLMILLEAYKEEEGRAYLKLKPRLAPYKAAVFPLMANKPELIKKAKEIFETVSGCYATAWDDSGNVGKRYKKQDEIGTPYCITVDYQTLEDNTVTIRDRDTMAQERVKFENINQWLYEKLVK